VDKELLGVLEDLRWHFNEPVKITSGCRCEAHNKAVGGAPESQHVKAKAADIRVSQHTPVEVHEYLVKRYPNQYGIGLYDNWVHIDVRPVKARW